MDHNGSYEWTAKHAGFLQKGLKKHGKQCFSDENVLVPKHVAIGKKNAKTNASAVVRTFKSVYLKDQSNLYVLYHRGGEGCIRFLGRSDQNSGWWQPKHSYGLILWGKCCTHKSAFILIRSSSYLQVIRTGIKYQFDFRPDLTVHFGVTCPVSA